MTKVGVDPTVSKHDSIFANKSKHMCTPVPVPVPVLIICPLAPLSGRVWDIIGQICVFPSLAGYML